MPANITVHRRQNVLSLFQQFAEEQMRAGVPPKGMEQIFAQKLQISPSMWSQIKSGPANRRSDGTADRMRTGGSV